MWRWKPATCAKASTVCTLWWRNGWARISRAVRCLCSAIDGTRGSKLFALMGRGFGCSVTSTLHTAHFGLLKLRYPFHPMFGTPLEVFGAAGGERDLVYVRLPNNTTRGVPAWMFDQAICAGVQTSARPIIDCGALLRLAQVLDSVKSERHSASHESDIKTPQSTNTKGPGSEPIAAGIGNASGQPMHSERSAHEVPAVVAGTA